MTKENVTMAKDKSLVSLGKRLKKAREEANLTQFQLYEKTGISTTQISGYENGNKSIGLSSLHRIALATNKTMDELYCGSESSRPITSSRNDGELIVNCVVALYDAEVIQANPKNRKNEFAPRGEEKYFRIGFSKFIDILDDMVLKLQDFEKNKDNYPDPQAFREQILASATKQINNVLNNRIFKLGI